MDVFVWSLRLALRFTIPFNPITIRAHAGHGTVHGEPRLRGFRSGETESDSEREGASRVATKSSDVGSDIIK